MTTSLVTKPLEQVETAALVVPVFEGRKEERFGAGPLCDAGEVTGKALECTLLHNVASVAARHVLLVGAGKPEAFTEADLRNLAGAALRHLKTRSIKSAALALEGALDTPGFARAAAEGAILGNFEPDQLKTGNDKKTFDSFTVIAASAGAEGAASAGRIVAEAQNFTRGLVNEPGNRLTPSKLAAAARAMASECGLGYEELDRAAMEKLGMGALLGVAQGSAEPPVFIIIRYSPQQASGKAHLGLVGKGVTFDSGGISIKPSDGMEKMRYDMAGGASVIGAMRAIAQLHAPVQVTAFIPCVENMPSGSAQRPGDIVTSLSGKTIEVINTDAEGRLILADALTYARSQGCTHLVDVATLTGAIVVALGHLNVGLFPSDDGMRDRLLSAAKAEGERLWAMPVEPDYMEYLKSPFADLANVGGRWGGSITAALFLKEFAADTPWAHLDIAGTAWLEETKPYMVKGPSGVPVRTLARLATGWQD